jgi:hypothetical protein
MHMSAAVFDICRIPGLDCHGLSHQLPDPDVCHESRDADDEAADHILLVPEVPELAMLLCDVFCFVQRNERFTTAGHLIISFTSRFSRAFAR